MTLLDPTLPKDTPRAEGPHALARFAWGVLAFNLVVIVWGAFVRATGSGAGCGRHWPLCNGEVVPRPKSIATVIEMTHRLTSGLAMILVFALAFLIFRRTSRGDRVRRAAVLSSVFMLGEALLGAGLVLFELVAHDASLKRALSMVLHLGNTFLLLAALTTTAWLLARPRWENVYGARDGAAPLPRLVRGLIVLSLGMVLFLAASGAIAALGDTLFPARTLRDGLLQDVSPAAHLFTRLRLLHPFIALATGAAVLGTAAMARAFAPSPLVRRFAWLLTTLFVVQFCAGLLNVTLLAPVWLQLVHLLLADVTWMALVLLAWEGIYAPSMSRNGPGPMSEVPPSMSKVEPVTYAPAGETR